MTDLKWFTATEVVLADKLVHNPNSTSEMWDRLNNVQVAIQEGFLHIDPRQEKDRGTYGTSEDIFIVPAASVVSVKHKGQ